MKKSIVIVCGVILVGGLGVWARFSWSPLGEVVRGNGYIGIICNAEKCGADAVFVQNSWIPNQRTIATMEKDLMAWLAVRPDCAEQIIPSELPLYRRRYAGVINDGQRLIKIQFYHPRGGAERQRWLKKTFWTVGCSKWVFHVAYNANDRTFTDFGQNASTKVDDGWQCSPPYFSMKDFPSLLD